MVLRCYLYNPMSLQAPMRAEEISMAMAGADIVLLPGTQRRAVELDKVVEAKQQEKHVEYSFGWRRARW
eukprot:4565854-Lingulodinium_polyedra.AAC.1